jgi:hypothetical protein
MNKFHLKGIKVFHHREICVIKLAYLSFGVLTVALIPIRCTILHVNVYGDCLLFIWGRLIAPTVISPTLITPTVITPDTH